VTFLDLPAAHHAEGRVRLPGSKSLSNRFLLLAALATGDTELRGLLDADDTRVMVDALRQLGAAIDGNRVRGVGGLFPVKRADLFLGNAGTAFRPLTAALAMSGGDYRLHGVPRMHERPIRDLVDALRRIGAHIDYESQDGYPPIRIRPGSIDIDGPVRVRGDVSSQFLTALLMALPLAAPPDGARIEVAGDLISKPYIEITLNVMRRFGVTVARDGWSAFDVPRGRYKSPGPVFVEGDASAASYFLAAGAIGGGPVRVDGVGSGSTQGDVRFTEVLERMGATMHIGDTWIECVGPVPRTAAASQGSGAAGRSLRPLDMDLNHIPDAAMTAAVLALFADGPSTLRNIASWRVKETDRLAAMATELRKVGATVTEGADSLRIVPPAALVPHAAIETYDDHRMAMSFSLVALGGVAVRINDPECVAKTFPDYFDVFRTVIA
jgi:3-phosphoshikimate 1-carboxyvinyltransferase